MQAWQVPDAELDDLIQYVKSFAPRWRSETPGDEIVASPDPWPGREAEALARGVRVYHGLAQCAVACHPAYVTRAEIAAFTKELTGDGPARDPRRRLPAGRQGQRLRREDPAARLHVQPAPRRRHARRHLPGHRFRHRRDRHADLEERPARGRPVGAGPLRPVPGRVARRPRRGRAGPAPARSARLDTAARCPRRTPRRRRAASAATRALAVSLRMAIDTAKKIAGGTSRKNPTRRSAGPSVDDCPRQLGQSAQAGRGARSASAVRDAVRALIGALPCRRPPASAPRRIRPPAPSPAAPGGARAAGASPGG